MQYYTACKEFLVVYLSCGRGLPQVLYSVNCQAHTHK
nr:MAG TPA: hypothetical protein [Caudoviricetes sp.]